MYRPKTAIMCTGGLDSTILLYKESHLNPIPITVNYGQVAFDKQVELLNHHIEVLNLSPLVILEIPLFDWQKKEGLFTQGYQPKEEKPLEDWNKLRYEDFFVEGRNTIMVSYILAYCSAHGIDELLAGYLYGAEEWQNRRSYKLMTGDNSPQFVDTLNLVSQLGFSNQVRFRAPYYELKWDKKDIIKWAEENDVDYSKTYSCYFIPACGVCDNCLLRKELKIDK